MKAIIVEDETLAAQNLKGILNEIGTLEIIATLESVSETILVPVKGDKLVPLNTDDIAYFFIDYGTVKSISLDNKTYNMDHTLDELEEMLNPEIFFRANRQFIISRKAIKDIDLWFNNRLSVNLKVSVPEKILVSKARVPEFKSWFVGKK
ncbi:MAG: two-component system response regulator [Bacteroidetes bacterium]|nr:two-component system response regulator [Bacteroidota bacterium]